MDINYLDDMMDKMLVAVDSMIDKKIYDNEYYSFGKEFVNLERWAFGVITNGKKDVMLCVPTQKRMPAVSRFVPTSIKSELRTTQGNYIGGSLDAEISSYYFNQNQANNWYMNIRFRDTSGSNLLIPAAEVNNTPVAGLIILSGTIEEVV